MHACNVQCTKLKLFQLSNDYYEHIKNVVTCKCNLEGLYHEIFIGGRWCGWMGVAYGRSRLWF